jgi:hypothetical protein
MYIAKKEVEEEEAERMDGWKKKRVVFSRTSKAARR